MGKRPPGPGRGHKVKQGNGPGWGGEAKGAGNQAPVPGPPWTTEQALILAEHKAAPEEQARRHVTVMTRQQLRGVMSWLAENAEYEQVRLAAADRLDEKLAKDQAAGERQVRRIDVSKLTPEQQELLLAAIEAGIVSDQGNGQV